MITYETDAAGEVAMTECAWECDSEGNWVTDCGGTFILNEGTPGDNRMAFCCYCGKSLKETFSEAGAETERCINRRARPRPRSALTCRASG